MSLCAAYRVLVFHDLEDIYDRGVESIMTARPSGICLPQKLALSQ
jgi:hypothetical protein